MFLDFPNLIIIKINFMTRLFKLLKVNKTHEENKPLILKHGIMVMPSVIYF